MAWCDRLLGGRAEGTLNSGDRGRKGRPLRGLQGFGLDDLAAGGTRRLEQRRKEGRSGGCWVCGSAAQGR